MNLELGVILILVTGIISKEVRYPLHLENGVKLQGYMWKPKEEVRTKALVFISHGYAEHLTPYYRAVAEAGVEAGLLMFGHDHLGHGRSQGERAQVGDIGEYVGPVIQHCQVMTDQHPGLPLFIIGHSMGGLVAVLAILETQPKELFSGAVLVSPLIKPDSAIANPLNNFLAKIFSQIYPSFTGLDGLDLSLITTNPYWLEVKRKDKLGYHGKYMAGLSHVLNTEVDKLSKRYKEMKTPFLMMISQRDRLTDPKASLKFSILASSEDKKVEYFNQGLHNFFIEKEDISRKAISQTVEWIINRI